MHKHHPDDKKLHGQIRRNEGDMPEKISYDILQNYYNNIQDDVLVIHGSQLPHVLRDKSLGLKEIDFIVVNFTKQYVMNLEVKTWLGPNEMDPQNDKKNNDKIK